MGADVLALTHAGSCTICKCQAARLSPSAAPLLLLVQGAMSSMCARGECGSGAS